jgi:hypothetical protein
MVNFGLNPASILGILLAVAGAGLYYLRSVRPELSRDHDIFFAAIGLLCGLILLFQGWRLDPILGLGQFLLSGTAVFFAVESIRMRGVATEQAKRNTRIVDDDRTVSDRYEYDYQATAELEELEPVDYNRPVKGRIRGTTDTRRSRTSEDYEGEGRRRQTRRPNDERLGPGEVQRQSRRRPEARPSERSEDAWTEPTEYDEWADDSPSSSNENWGDSSGGVVRNRRRPRPSGSYSAPESTPETPPSRSRSSRSRNRPPQKPVSGQPTEAEPTPTDYVDYQPIDHPENDGDNNSGNFDR